ncbi:hypothetical protein PIB30_023053 [Stylosanthes scabra]|uniref:Uncharacterized protein n=1 Tax=Stylosanthes scabra TaxID=79078 RepID=A0ABU6W911_9FABA|nr:hypothetical protein [Stylosanthes scabra]
MRKKAQEEKRALASPTSSSCHSSIASSNNNNNNNHAVDSHASKKAGEESFYDTGGPVMTVECSSQEKVKTAAAPEVEDGFSMDDIWKDIELSEEKKILYDGKSEEGCNFSSPPPPTSWEYSCDPLWVMEEESVLFPTSDPYFSCFAQGTSFLTG